MTDDQNRDPGRIALLDGYRGFAVLLVTLYRFAHEAFPEEVVGQIPSKAILIGMSGVDFFFVLSGFLITGILLKNKDSGSYFTEFYRNRILRIFPLYYGSLLLFLVVFPHVFNQDVFAKQVQKDEWCLWTFATNLSIAWHNEFHYGELDHFWSLAIEEQFYLVWPILVLWLRSEKLLRLCIVATLILAAIRMGCSIGGLGDTTARNFTLFRLDGLLLGSSAAILYREYGDLSKHYSWLRRATIVTTALYGLCVVAIDDDHDVRFVLISMVAMLLLLQALASPSGAIERRVFEFSAMRSLGKYSYAMYVFQYPLIPLLAPILSPKGLTGWIGNPIVAGLIYVAAMFVATYAVAVVSWYTFERHFLALKKHGQFASTTVTPRAVPN